MDLIQPIRNKSGNLRDITITPNSRNYTLLFPELTPCASHHSSKHNTLPINQSSESTFGTPSLPRHIHNLINNGPTAHASNYYTIAHVCNSTVIPKSNYIHKNTSNPDLSVILASPITCIEPGFNRPGVTNFEDLGQTIGT